MGHTAINCYHRFDNINYKPTNSNSTSKMAAMIATLDAIQDSAWFMDSGATHHITSNANNLDSTNPFNGNEKITVGDGWINTSCSCQTSIQILGVCLFNSNLYYQLLTYFYVRFQVSI
ncbi:hypothetical protein UlMin_001046 [Ulmus minor]